MQEGIIKVQCSFTLVIYKKSISFYRIMWLLTMREAILKGNEIHDDLFDNDAIDVAVDEAVELAGDECSVNCIESQCDIFGRNCN